MSKATKKFQKEIQESLALYYHQTHSEATKRGIRAAKVRRKLPTVADLPCKVL
jgi:hypothetical protein